VSTLTAGNGKVLQQAVEPELLKARRANANGDAPVFDVDPKRVGAASVKRIGYNALVETVNA
jgi:hypothetical protein